MIMAEASNNPDLFRKDQFDDPSTTTNKLLLALRQLDFRASFPSQKLRTPHGESVCVVLEFLADKALEKKNFKFNTPVYLDSAENNEALDADAENDEVEDEGMPDEEDDPIFQEASRPDEAADASIDQSNHQILQAAIDPIAWKTELERVGPKLRAQQQLSAHEWRAHVDQTLASKEQIDKILASAQGDLVTMTRYAPYRTPLLASYPISRVVSEETTRTRTKEKYISHQFAGLCTEFQEVRRR
jgi:intraflagellar transport protein 57